MATWRRYCSYRLNSFWIFRGHHASLLSHGDFLNICALIFHYMRTGVEQLEYIDVRVAFLQKDGKTFYIFLFNPSKIFVEAKAKQFIIDENGVLRSCVSWQHCSPVCVSLSQKNLQVHISIWKYLQFLPPNNVHCVNGSFLKNLFTQ